eukprot:CAMPEP_0198324450 /NCGR_PEP_ID=MMETSP1450-20131203/12460_1 /TAXON_ID=753684 ORGANISM="Madagascaria erythrocladiodes, Strain CCMP3234" /NCGR_SAMPLE_ID=MMETSP1450 /ASSEMBLY_ACC=CAM_ASM_001115 /LENGTH=95 /DNA_ID=CAMNT_0044028247 /DNA_START=16 /DNA_END=300 /DNA_ORIENTATION=-
MLSSLIAALHGVLFVDVGNVHALRFDVYFALNAAWLVAFVAVAYVAVLFVVKHVSAEFRTPALPKFPIGQFVVDKGRLLQSIDKSGGGGVGGGGG